MQHQILEVLSKLVRQNNLIYGVCDANPLEIVDILQKAQTPFVTSDLLKRTDPKQSLASAESIIVFGMPYDKKLVSNVPHDLTERMQISVSAVGIDYHVLLENVLREAVAEIVKLTALDFQIFVDTGPLVERELAFKAGLGSYGKNRSLISEEFGSFFNIGYILTNLNLPKSAKKQRVARLCNGCNLCASHCPGGALSYSDPVESAPPFFTNLCTSYLTQKKGELSPFEMVTIGKNLYGCDICTRICPLNQGKPQQEIYDINAINPLITDILNLTPEQFQANFKQTAMGWRGCETLIRNAKIAQINKQI